MSCSQKAHPAEGRGGMGHLAVGTSSDPRMVSIGIRLLYLLWGKRHPMLGLGRVSWTGGTDLMLMETMCVVLLPILANLNPF